MSKVRMIGIDLQRTFSRFLVCDQFGTVVLRKKLRRGGVIAYLAKQPICSVAM